jgi:hypothetical protein
MQQEIETAPIIPDAREYRCELTGLAHLAPHNDRALEALGERADVGLRLRIQVRDGKVGAGAAKRAGATIGYAVVVGDADDQSFFAI